MNILLRVVALCSVTAVILASGWSAEAVQPPTTATPPAASASAALPEATEIKILQRQLEDSRKFQEQILATVYWSLGGLATIAAALVGFGWFANFRVYERDRASLERDLRVQITEDANALRSQVNDSLMAGEKRLQEGLASQLGQFDERTNVSLKKALAELERNLLAAQSRTSADLNSLKREVLRLKIDAKLEERRSWIEKKIFRNALQESVSALEYANQDGFEFKVGEVLDLVSADMSAVNSSESLPIDNFLVAQLVAALDSVKGGHAHAAASLKARTNALLAK